MNTIDQLRLSIAESELIVAHAEKVCAKEQGILTQLRDQLAAALSPFEVGQRVIQKSRKWDRHKHATLSVETEFEITRIAPHYRDDKPAHYGRKILRTGELGQQDKRLDGCEQESIRAKSA